MAKPSIAARELEPRRLKDVLKARLKVAIPFEHSRLFPLRAAGHGPYAGS